MVIKPKSYRRKPLVFKALPWTGRNLTQVARFMGLRYTLPTVTDGKLLVFTLEGKHWASPGDMIVRGVKNEYWAVKPDIFAESYEPIA